MHRINLDFTQLMSKKVCCEELWAVYARVYNKALAARTQAWYEHKERVGYKQTSAMLTNWKKQEDLDFLDRVSSVPFQQGGSPSTNCFSFGMLRKQQLF